MLSSFPLRNYWIRTDPAFLCWLFHSVLKFAGDVRHHRMMSPNRAHGLNHSRYQAVEQPAGIFSTGNNLFGCFNNFLWIFLLQKRYLQSNPFDRFHSIPNRQTHRQSIQVFGMVQNDEKAVNQVLDPQKLNQILAPDSISVWSGAKISRLDCHPILNLQTLAAVNSCHLA